MPDVILPAGASIAAFVMAVLSWYGMLRTGIQLVYNDIQAASSVKRDIEAMMEDLHSQDRTIQDWKTLWFVWDETPESMFEVFWGQPEYQNIKTKLSNMHINCEDAKKKLGSFISVSEKKGSVLHKLRKKYRKWRFIWMEKDYVQKLIKILSEDLSAIQKAAIGGWRRRDPYLRRGELDPRAVYHAGIGHLLVRIASSTRDDANALHSCCRPTQEDFKIELELNLFNHTNPPPIDAPSPLSSSEKTPREEHSTAVAAADKKGHFVWNVLSQNLLPGDTSLTRLRVERAAQTTPDPLPNCPAALTRIMGGNATKCHFIGSGVCFSIGMAGTPYECAPEPRQSLRQLLFDNIPPNENLLGTISKFRLTFELAQACLLLLRTTWFPRICSCEIQCGPCAPKSTEFTYGFGLRIGTFTHETPRSQTMEGPWCSASHYKWNFPTKPLRRLGILLVEIVLGTQINSLELMDDNSGTIRGINFMDGEPGDETRSTDELDGVMNRVRNKFGESRKCTEAIRYCLTEDFDEAPTDDDMRKLLAKIYHRVVEP